ncbi:MAG: hypothetical protein WCP41_05630 [Verrucomicrobiota bacterium]|jgi:hypothetical protein
MQGISLRFRMVYLFIALAATSFLPMQGLLAQQESSDAAFIVPKPKKAKVEQKTDVGAPSAYNIQGIVAQAFKMKHPLQMLSPLAPKKDGDGHDDIAWDPDNPEKPKGIIFFGVQW